VVIIGPALNKFPFSLVTQKGIDHPSKLAGKRIGIVNFGGSNELAIVLALKEWGIPRQAVTFNPQRRHRGPADLPRESKPRRNFVVDAVHPRGPETWP